MTSCPNADRLIDSSDQLHIFQDIMRTADVAAMWDLNAYNAGFIVVKPTANGIKLWQLTCNMTSVQKRFNDQQAFNKAIKQLKGELTMNWFIHILFVSL
jgi:Nucleotide-diphospho-sugar transferase